MAYRVIFWRPRQGINVWLPAKQPLGETIRTEVLAGGLSDLLDDFPAEEMMQRLETVFAKTRDEKGHLDWTDEIDNGFIASKGYQFVEVCSFELTDEDLDKIFEVASEFTSKHYDWGN